MFSAFKQYFYNPVCFKCGSIFVEEHLFCEFCFTKDISERIALKVRCIESRNKIIKHYYIFEWKPGESDLFSKLVYQLKSDRCVKAIRYYANLITKQLKAYDFSMKSYDLILPLPGSLKSSVHADLLAEEISKTLGTPFMKLLIKNINQDAQKKKTLSQRKETVINVKTDIKDEQITNLLRNKPNIIYVDDVLTTGNTFKAALKATEPNGEACIFTLFYRPSMQDV